MLCNESPEMPLMFEKTAIQQPQLNSENRISRNESNAVLSKRAAELIRQHFHGKEITNLLIVRYGKKWKTKLGHIKPMKRNPSFGSLIELNSIFLDSRIPEWLIDLVLLHELVHYFDGFGSNIPRNKLHPHRGNCVDRELKKFGYTELLEKQKSWLKENWANLYREHCGNRQKIARRKGFFAKILSMI